MLSWDRAPLVRSRPLNIALSIVSKLYLFNSVIQRGGLHNGILLINIAPDKLIPVI